MRVLLSTLLLALGAGTGAAAQAQNCGSGGGATVCLTANGSASSVQLGWTVSGAVKSLEIYRDTDANPQGRTRIAVVDKAATSYADTSAANGTPYWYWVKFTTNAGSYNSGSATATRGSTCTPTAITPYINVGGSWTQTASASVPAGQSAILGPQPVAGGMWSWNGCGTSGGSREQTITPTAACTATATYTNACGAKTLQSFSISIAGAMRNITALQMSKEMSPGWNIGNTLDATPTETSWGNPLINQELLNGIKAAGFKSVRVPVTWSTHADTSHNIDPAWMARVTQVVKYARNAGLYVIINVHHDGYELNNTTYANQPANNAHLAKLWTQIAANFKDYDDYLLFAGINEIGMPNAPWGVPKSQEWLDVVNGYNQVFVTTVRASGGNNAKRHLVVQGYETNIDISYDSTVLPTDTIADRLFFEIHYYDPYNFALNDKSTQWQWGASATDPNVETWANEPYVDAQFQKMKTRFIDKGVPVIMGEYGAYNKPNFPGMAPYRKAWAQYVTRSAWLHGLVPMWWDTGEMIDRSTGAVKTPDEISTIVNASK
ncbi:MAG TPA: glycoside hydrolase family 5 protein [Magnetospirillum sp.]|nr:glycoside hydrolase family 5 protein [Magnetospirillum sp.]